MLSVITGSMYIMYMDECLLDGYSKAIYFIVYKEFTGSTLTFLET